MVCALVDINKALDWSLRFVKDWVVEKRDELHCKQRFARYINHGVQPVRQEYISFIQDVTHSGDQLLAGVTTMGPDSLNDTQLADQAIIVLSKLTRSLWMWLVDHTQPLNQQEQHEERLLLSTRSNWWNLNFLHGILIATTTCNHGFVVESLTAESGGGLVEARANVVSVIFEGD
ncbi:hypothetical protein ACA910_022750 [Epithemia clementina (nom. ined.)]